jgi:hypothetical protein
MPADRSTPWLKRTFFEALLLAVAGIGIGFLAVCRSVSAYDEGLVVTAAQRLLHGELPWRDYFAPYPPGQAYLVAAHFALFGASVLTMRVYDIVVRALLALMLYRIARRLAGGALASLAWGAAILWLTSYGFFGYPTFPAMLLVVFDLWLLASCADRVSKEGGPSRMRLFAAGGALGLCGFVRHDLTLYAFAASAPSLVYLAGWRPAAPNDPARRARLQPVRLWPFVAGFALMFGIPAIWLLSNVPIREVVFELFEYSLKIYPATRALPYPGLLLPYFSPTNPADWGLQLDLLLLDLPYYLPLLVYFLGLASIAIRIRREGWAAALEPRTLLLSGVLVFGALGFNLVRVRADIVHGAAMVLPSYVVAAALLHDLRAERGRWRSLAAFGIGGSCLLSLAWPIGYFPTEVIARLVAPRAAGAGVVCGDVGRDREAAAAFIRSVVPHDRRILVACGRHDRVDINEPILYFLADRLPSTLYHQFDPGVTTTLEAQREIVNGLARHRVEYVVVSTAFDVRDAPTDPPANGAHFLDDYLRSHYRVVRQFGSDYSVWRRSANWE